MSESHADTILERLEKLAMIEPDRQRAHQAVERAKGKLASLTAGTTVSSSNRRRRAVQVVSLVTGLCLAIALFVWLWPDGGASLAYAEVKQRLAQTKSISYLTTHTLVYLREERDGEHFGKDSRSVMHQIVLESGTMYRDQPDEGITTVFDRTKGVMLTLDHRAKEAFLNAVDPERLLNLYDDLLSLEPDEGQELKERVIDGQRCVGFPAGKSNRFHPDTMIWVGIKSKLPVLIEYVQTDGDSYLVTIASTDFQFDAPYDESLFSLDPPKGYRLREGPIETLYLVPDESERKKDAASSLESREPE